MDRELLRQVGGLRAALTGAVVLGVLGTVTTIFQITFLAIVIGRVFLSGAGLEGVRTPLLLLLGAVVLRPVLLWLQQVVARRGRRGRSSGCATAYLPTP